MKMILLAFWSFIQVFVLCDLSERVNNNFNEIDFYQCNWYEFPIHIRRLIPTIILYTKKPIILEGFGNIKCTRETCLQVIWIDIIFGILCDESGQGFGYWHEKLTFSTVAGVKRRIFILYDTSTIFEISR